ncbi:MAG: mannonate dehydratase [Selenomonas sp.]|uniref:mannonate dehydratase n=1 Tax=Selenomonas sp. TaxID=2053611 RepID=UPI0025FA8FF3|nr:mannonate dehydratase [Selenomonas sp.]MCR5757940.1 mannonate dehydratase [Selenomonas sp.]
MDMTFRWYGDKEDNITLKQIRQIPGMQGVVWALFDVPVGEVWPEEEIAAVTEEIAAYGLHYRTVESVNVHEDIKLGLPSRDKYIENYITTLRRLAKVGVKTVCYNFMPVFDWTRTDLAKRLYDGSTAMAFDYRLIKDKTPEQMVKDIQDGSKGFSMAGWEPERLQSISKLFDMYKDIDRNKLFAHLAYFLQAVVPVAEECGIRMAIHPDDPPRSVFGLPRIVSSEEDLERIVKMVDSPSNSLTICSGSLGANLANNIPRIIRRFGKMNRIGFAHIRNIQVHEPWVFNEISHKSEYGSLDMYDMMKALYETGFTGPVRPDHGRMIWGEEGRPGYGLYDRALGANYLCGLWDAIVRENS